MARLFLFQLLSLILFSACRQTRPESYRLALRYIPEAVDPRKNQINTNNLIMLQLYYPLLSFDKNGVLRSYFLDESKTISKNSKFDSYRLCLKPNLHFSDSSPVRSADLAKSVIDFHSVLESLPKIKGIRNETPCVSVDLETSDPDYFSKLTGVATTILKSESTSAPFPIGLGSFRLLSKSPDSISLERSNCSARFAGVNSYGA
jgi:hypothetical protein